LFIEKDREVEDETYDERYREPGDIARIQITVEEIDEK
jgi:hypothetical protein